MPKIVQKNAVLSRLQAGMASDHVNGFTQWLHQRQYTPLTIRERLRLLACWTNWARETGYRSIDAVREAHAVSFALVKAGSQRRFRGDVNKDAVEVAKLFIKYLEECGVLKRPPAKAVAPIVSEFIAWTREQRGLAETTLARYQWTVARFVEALGNDPAAYNANAIRSYLMERAKAVSVDRDQSVFAVPDCYKAMSTGARYALPKIASRALTSIPRSLRETDINRIIDVCDGEDRLRDWAIILLLARLGLRASEIARLTFDDTKWRQGSIRVFRKPPRGIAAAQPGVGRCSSRLCQEDAAEACNTGDLPYRIRSDTADQPYRNQVFGLPRTGSGWSRKHSSRSSYTTPLGGDVHVAPWRQSG